MGKDRKKIYSRIVGILSAVLVAGAVAVMPFIVTGQYQSRGITPPPPASYQPSLVRAADSIMMPFPIQQTVPQNYEALMADELAYDLTTPSNIKTQA